MILPTTANCFGLTCTVTSSPACSCAVLTTCAGMRSVPSLPIWSFVVSVSCALRITCTSWVNTFFLHPRLGGVGLSVGHCWVGVEQLGQQDLRALPLHTRVPRASEGSGWSTAALLRRALDRLPRTGYDRPNAVYADIVVGLLFPDVTATSCGATRRRDATHGGPA